ncbi:hypothetical protein TARUN_8964 [Trichoderma arundinaceum]|uniref:Uncharacterized protein n=1 Tax=Trichoderma arundinaceum TaxID=490622 RepID=A0A395NC47_TRIAR|nr:hypothetical protein TARUN_8964 [Trichoderma arundinaceum]
MYSALAQDYLQAHRAGFAQTESVTPTRPSVRDDLKAGLPGFTGTKYRHEALIGRAESGVFQYGVLQGPPPARNGRIQGVWANGSSNNLLISHKL